jgi:hypothetical protein
MILLRLSARLFSAFMPEKLSPLSYLLTRDICAGEAAFEPSRRSKQLHVFAPPGGLRTCLFNQYEAPSASIRLAAPKVVGPFWHRGRLNRSWVLSAGRGGRRDGRSRRKQHTAQCQCPALLKRRPILAPSTDSGIRAPGARPNGPGFGTGGYLTIQSGGQSRGFALRLPDNYDNNKPYWLIFGVHWNSVLTCAAVPTEEVASSSHPRWSFSALMRLAQC